MPPFPDQEAAVEPLLAVADLAVSLAWWQDVVGGEVLESGSDYALLALGRSRLHLAETGEPPPDRSVRLTPPDRSPHEATGEVVIVVNDCRRVTDELVGRGLQLLSPPASPPWGGEVRAFAFDPDGHLVEFTSTDP